MSLMAPSKVMVPSPVPLPTENTRPEVLPRVIRPLLAVRVTRSVPPPASTSAMEIALPLPALKVSTPFSRTVWLPGTVLTGASFTALTTRVSEELSVWLPPLPVLPPSSMLSESTTLLVALLAVV
ncbi:hypothetical protein D9M68_464100 [compost metagenome]